MYSLLENIFASKELYQTILTPICDQYDLSYAELITLLYLGSGRPGDTATDIVENLRITKSTVSMSVRMLMERGLVSGEHIDGNHRTVHLTACESAREIIERGMIAQKLFYDIVTDGFSEEEIDRLKACFIQMSSNIKSYRNTRK